MLDHISKGRMEMGLSRGASPHESLRHGVVREEGAAAQVFLNVTNVFDRDPILLPTTGVSANTTFSDLLGRAFRVGIRMQTR